MSALFKSIIVATFGLLLAVVLGVQIGEGSFAAPIVLLVALAAGSFYLLFFRATAVEALILGGLLLGYLVGNRGFAQLSLSGSSPLYLGEIGLVACAMMLVTRMALQRERLLPESPLGWAIFAFLLLGATRLFLDAVVRVGSADRITAIRDSATVYYAFFFLVAYRLGSHPGSRRVLERCLWAGLLALPFVVLIWMFAPHWLMAVRVRGVPVIFHKYDLTTAYLAFGSIYFFLAAAEGRKRLLRLSASVIYLCLMLMIVTRAAIFGFACATLLLLLGRQTRFLLLQATMVLIVAMGVASLQVADTGGQSFLEPLTDKVQSMTDISQNRSYRGAAGQVASDNNQWRITWWRNVFRETATNAPLFGLGFGHDLATEFVRDYYGNRHGGFETRSPHSIWVTVYGRMGLIGLASFTAIGFLIVRNAFAAARRVARRDAPAASLGHWCAVLIILGSASFGVVLEGPMGGIVFWALLGLAASQKTAVAMRAQPASTISRPQPQRAPALQPVEV